VREFYWVNGESRRDREDGGDGESQMSDLRFEISEDRRKEGGPGRGAEVRRQKTEGGPVGGGRRLEKCERCERCEGWVSRWGG